MKFLCLGYGEERAWDAMSKAQQDGMIEECFGYDDELVKKGHWLDGGQALQSARAAKTVCYKDGKVVVTDGPFAETKEVLGGVGVLEARDMDQAVELVSRHPGLQFGPFEIRPIDEAADQRNLALDARHEATAGGKATMDAGAQQFACLGYIGGGSFANRPPGEFEAMLNECLAFDEQRRRNGQWLGGFGLQATTTAKTVRRKGDKVVVTDGPYAETKEWLGGLVAMQLKDMGQAVELLSTHPGLRYGVAIEIRPIAREINARWEARQQRVKKS